MNISLINSAIDNLSFKKNEGAEMPDDKFHFHQAFSDNNPNSFLIIFEIDLNIEESHLLSIRHLSEFSTSEVIKENDRESKFFTINAPAIAYPFLRSFVSNFLLSSGFKPIILPTINFVKVVEDNAKE